MSEIVSLYGDKIAAPYEPVKGTIETLEDLLEKARSGEIKGIHAVIVYGDDSAGTICTLMPSYRSLGALAALSAGMAKELNEEGN